MSWVYKAPVTNVFLLPKRAASILRGHPWVFSGMIERVEGSPALGDQVCVLVAGTRRFVGVGLFHPGSEIRVRMYSKTERLLDEGFFREAISKAIDLRKKALGQDFSACRLVFSEADGLSGLTCDRYGDYLILQLTSAALFQRREWIAESFRSLLSPKGILLKSVPAMAKKEGLPTDDQVLWGEIPDSPIVIQDHGLQIEVSLRSGQKTGFYFDQRENRLAVAKFAEGRRVLDLYCYSGGFSLHAARAGASEVTGVDSSKPAIALAKRNAELNHLSNVSFLQADALEFLQSKTSPSYSMIILDPPKFVTSREAKKNALRLYYRLNEAAMNVLEPGGILVSCSCSGRVNRNEWKSLVSSVARRLRRKFEILEFRGAGRDHPVVPLIPETEYLKCLIARMM